MICWRVRAQANPGVDAALTHRKQIARYRLRRLVEFRVASGAVDGVLVVYDHAGVAEKIDHRDDSGEGWVAVSTEACIHSLAPWLRVLPRLLQHRITVLILVDRDEAERLDAKRARGATVAGSVGAYEVRHELWRVRVELETVGATLQEDGGLRHCRKRPSVGLRPVLEGVRERDRRREAQRLQDPCATLLRGAVLLPTRTGAVPRRLVSTAQS